MARPGAKPSRSHEDRPGGFRHRVAGHQLGGADRFEHEAGGPAGEGAGRGRNHRRQHRRGRQAEHGDGHADADGGHDRQDHGGDDQRDSGQPPGRDGEAVPPGRVVPFLGQRLEGVERGDEQGHAGHDHQRRGALPRPSGGQPGHDAEADDPQNAGGRPAHQAVHGTPAHHRRRLFRSGLPDGHPGPRPGLLGGQAAAEQDDGPEVLEAQGEAQLGGQAAPPLGGFQRHVPQPGGGHRQHGDGRTTPTATASRG